MKSGNPALNEKTFSRSFDSITTERMTINGTVLKTGILTALVSVSAGYTWQQWAVAGHGTAVPFMFAGVVGGFIVAMVTIFKKTWAPVTAPLYAVLEGLALGGISASLSDKYGLIPMEAVGLTFATLAAMLISYTSGLIRATENFKLGVVAATGGICIYYLIAMLLNAFGHIQAPMIWDGGPMGIAFSAFVIIIAALNLVIDFDFIDSGVKSGAPKFMEWYGAFGLLVTLVWLYLEILRLLSKVNRK